MSKPKPFIDFYKQLGVIPVTQDISNLQNHFDRRRGLYLHLGIPPLFVRDRTVLEFGPGTGQNALFTASHGPSHYTLVDGNPKSVERTAETLRPWIKRTPIEIVRRDILEYRSKKKFDLVLCEGLIPTQLNPASFFEYVFNFAAPGGVVVITCMDSVSVLSEALRRYLAYHACPDDVPVKERIEILTQFFGPHFKALPGMSRRHDEWVIDNIIHPWTGRLFSIADAIEAGAGKLVVLGSSPRYLNDWRWYKRIVGHEAVSNASVEECYWRNLHSFIDHQAVLPPREIVTNRKLLRRADHIFERIHGQEQTGKKYPMPELARDLRQLIALLGLPQSRLSRALREYVGALESYNGKWRQLKIFPALWGRGQQYISFVKL